MITTTAFFQKKIDEEIAHLGSKAGPLYKSAYSNNFLENTTNKNSKILKGESPDFIDDKANIPAGLEDFVIHKYRDRIIFIPTNNCAAKCSYCFRENLLSTSNHLSEKNSKLSLEKKIEKLITYINRKPLIKELILSGGDPLILSSEKLKFIFEKVLRDTSIEDIRIHSRTIIFSPALITSDKINILSKVKARFVGHSIHPYEICSEVKEKFKELQSFGISCYNQFPLLRGINDNSKVLEKHLRLLDNLNIRNLSIFMAEPIFNSAGFRVSIPRLFSIIDELNWTSPSWINATRFVLDSVHGKLRREDMQSYNRNSGLAIFKREGKLVEYWDLPSHMDIPGDLKTMLWKG